VRWAKTDSVAVGGTDTWQMFYQIDSNATGTQSAWQNVGTVFKFNSSGQMNPPLSSLTLPNLTVNGDNLGNVQLVLGNNGLTQFADTSGTAQVNQFHQNGFAAGKLQSIAVNGQNRVVGTFSNGQNIPLSGGHPGELQRPGRAAGAQRRRLCGDGRFRPAAVLGNRANRGQLGRGLQRRYRHPVQSSDRGAAGLFGQRQGDDDGQPDDAEPAHRGPVMRRGVRCATEVPVQVRTTVDAGERQAA
jgi:hypothetical protein